jgi:hypothetical protein
MITKNFIVATLAVAALLAAWGGNPMIGTSGSGAAGTTGASGTTGMAGASGAARTGEPVGPLGRTESWTGYVENFKFKSGSDALKLSFATDDAGHAVGTITFGQGAPPPPATDPNVEYPPSFFASKPIAGTIGYIAEGYSYAFTGTREGSRLRFKAPLRQLWSGWCALQTAYPSGTCIPSNETRRDLAQNDCAYHDTSTKQWPAIDCGKLRLCVDVPPCQCDDTSCRVSLKVGGDVSLDVTISGSTARGSIGGPFIDGNVQFTKAP